MRTSWLNTASFRLLLCLILLAPSAQAACVPSPTGLVGWWKGDGTASDVVSSNNGVLVNVGYTSGVVGQAFSFDPENYAYGTYTGVQIPDQPAYALTNSLTIEGWVRPRGDGYIIFWRGDNRPGLDPYILSMQGNHTVLFQISDANGNGANVGTTLTYNQWYHLAATLDGGSGTMSLYTNGVLAAQMTTSIRPFGSLIAGDSPGMGIGNLNDGQNNFPFTGDIDEIALYNRALSASEIQSIYNAGSAGKCTPVVTTTNNCVAAPSGLVGWWPGEGNANDVIGGDNGTLQGGAVFAPGKVGQGFRFDGTNGYVQIPDSAALKPANITCEAWVWLDPNLPAGRGGEVVVFKKNTWSAWFEGYNLVKGTIDNGNGTSSDRFQFVVSRYGNQVVINSQTIAQRGVWYHVAATYDGNQSVLYVNGVAEASAIAGFALDYDTTPVFIGTSGTWPPYLSMFGGIIDELSIYNRALSSNEIAAIYNAGIAGKCGPPPTPPSITSQPASQALSVGQTVTFSVVASGTSPLSYQWQLGGMSINGATNSTLTLAYVQTTNAGFYSVVVTNLAGSTVSSNATLTVNLPGTCYPAPSGLVGWWPGEGNANDIAGGDNGTLQGGATFAPGKVGQGFRFDGTNGYVQIPDSAALKPANITCEAWVWLDPNLPAGRGGEVVVFKKNTWSAWFEGYNLVKGTIDNGNGTSSDRFQFVVSRYGNQVVINSQTIAQRGVWYHVAATYDGNQSVLYVNGVAEASAIAGFALDYDTTPVFIGTSGTWPPYLSMFGGIIDEVSIYNRALSSNEIAAIYNAGTAGKCSAQTLPVIISQPTNQAVLTGGTATFTVVATGGQTLNYQWQFNGTNLPPIITTVAGNGIGTYGGDGGAANNASLSSPNGVASDAAGNLYIADTGNHRIRRVDTNGIITTVAGNGVGTYGGDGGAAANTSLNNPNGVALDAAGNLYIADRSNQRIRKVDKNGIITTVAGNGSAGTPYGENGIPATSASLWNPQGVALDGAGNLFIADWFNSQIRKVDTNGIITTFAGNFTTFYCGDGGAATNACLNNPQGAASDTFGNLFIADKSNHRIRKVDTNGIISTVAGNGIGAYGGDGGAATSASLNNPQGLAFDMFGNLFVADAGNNCIRELDVNGIITTVAGNSIGAYAGDGGAAANASLNNPQGVASDSSGNLYIADSSNQRVREVKFARYPTLVLNNINTNDAGNYTVVITSAYGSVTSAVATLTVPLPPNITAQPMSQTAPVGSTAIISVTADGTAPLSYQWSLNSTNIPGATNAALEFVNVQFTNAGTYSVMVTNAYGSVMSSNAVLTVVPAICVNPPANLISWWRGESNALDEVSGNDGVLMNGTGFAPGQVGTAFQFDGASNYVQIPATPLLDIYGHFTVEAWIQLSAPAGTNGATIFMRTPDDGSPADWALTISPNQKLRPEINLHGTIHSFECNTTLQPGVWYHVAMVYYDGDFLFGYVNGNFDGYEDALDSDPYLGESKVAHPMKIGGSPADNSFFAGEIDEVAVYNRALNYFQFGDIAGLYTAGSAGKCDLPVAPTIMADPVGATVLPGANAAFSVTVAGSRPLSYQWLVNSAPLAGETNATLTLNSVQYPQSGNGYSVTVTNAGGSATSASATLTLINTPPQITNPGNQIVSYVSPPLALAFAVSDAESPAASLAVTGASSNTNLVPNEQIIFAGTDSSRTVTLTPNSNQLGVATITLTVTDPGNLSSQAGFNLTVTNYPPQISPISNQIISYNTATVPLAFAVSDFETPADSLVLVPSSSNTNLLPVSQIVLGGSGTNRTVVLTPNANQFGVATVMLLVADELGATSQSVFNLTVTNFPPHISSIAAQSAPLNAVIGPLAFTVADDQTPANQIIVTASSSSSSIVPTNQIVLGGAGANRTVTILPGANAPGTATITLTATDGLGASSSTSFAVTLNQFTPIAPGIPALSYSAVAWGDYDNDGQLDLLVNGTTNGQASGAVTRIYHNLGGVFTNTSFIGLTNLFHAAVAWADYDRDGRLDAIVSGLNSANIPVTQLYHNNGDGTFTPVNVGLAGAYSGTLAWGDFDNNGTPDLFLSGLIITSTNGTAAVTTNIAKLYRNNGDGTFTDLNASFLTSDNRTAGPNNGTASWGDFDNDGKLDLLLVGSINNQYGIASVYRNLGNGVFTNVFSSGVASYYGGAGAWGDHNNDGWLDMVISGGLGSTVVYRNNGNGTFTQTSSFSSGSTPSVAWGDFNNDGWLDLLVGTGSSSALYRNNGNGTFTSAGLSLPVVPNGSLAWGDYNNDGNLDLLFSGNTMSIYRNNNGVTNTPPAAPTNLAAATGLTNAVVLTWTPPLDSQTTSSGLNYNLRVGTTPGGMDVVSPLADPTNGTRRVAALGNVGPTNRALLINLPQGAYYWSVQAIDTAFAGSPFAADGMFAITNSRPTISPIADQYIAPGTNTPSAPIACAVGDAETDAGNLVLSVRSSNTNVVALANVVFGGSGSNRTVRIVARTNGISFITITVTDAQGAFVNDYFTVHAEQFTQLSNNLVQVQNSFIVWGDYNNDGRLDVLIAGATNGNTGSPFPFPLQPVTQLYRNDGNGVFTPVVTGLPGVTRGSAAWGDFNNDGYLDLILTGTTNNATSGALSRIYRNNGDGTFTDLGAGLPGVYSGAVAWGDFDGDGRLDLLLTGTTNSSFSGAVSPIYHNNGDGTFTNKFSLPGFTASAVACADLDGDGRLDIVVCGLNTLGNAVTAVFRNNGNGSFTQATSLTGISSGAVAIGDFDNDGRPDILIAGYTGSTATTLLYHNNGNFNFSSTGVSLPAARLSSVAWGDFDNDGRLDILISGSSTLTLPATAGAFTRIYRNTGSATLSQSFTNFPVSLPTNYSGTVTWADFNNDGKLDILMAGTDGVNDKLQTARSQTFLFRNNNNVANTPPSAPTALAWTRSYPFIKLAWARSADAQTTNSNGLKYQIRVGTAPGAMDIATPESDLTTGFRRLVQTGDASTNQWILANLAPGTYYWSVQAIDTAFAGSPFSTESTFSVLSSPIVNPDAFSTPLNTPVTFPAAKLTLNDFDPSGLSLYVAGVSPTSAMGGTVSLYGIPGTLLVSYTPPTNFSGNDTFTYTASDGQSAPAAGVVTVTVGSGGTISLNIISGPVMAGGNFVVGFAGIPGLTYTVEATSDLGGPWTKVANLTAPTTDQGLGVGGFEFTEPAGTNATRFYRTVYPAY